MREPSVVGRRLAQRYGRHQVFEGLDFTVPNGVTGLLGPNGAGKTTLLRTVCTLDSPTGGTLRVLGLDVSRRAELRMLRQRLGFLPQVFGYYPDFTVKEFVTYAAWLKRVPKSESRKCVDDALASVGLSDRADSKLRTLSGGMLRRAGIAHAIVHRPELLVLDEPTAGLDPQQRIDLRALVRRIGTDTTVIVSTHLVEDVAAMCAQVQVLAPGRFVFVGTPEELAAAAVPGAAGDNDLERGYSSVLAGSAVAG